MWFLGKRGGVSGLPAQVRSLLGPADRSVEFVSLAEGGFLVVSLSRFFVFCDGEVVSEFSWSEVSQAKWDDESELLVFLLQDGSASLCFSLVEAPSRFFMDTVREGIASVQVFWGVVELPSGSEVTCRVLRDEARNFRFLPDPDGVENLDDQRVLRQQWAAWQSRLGLDVL